MGGSKNNDMKKQILSILFAVAAIACTTTSKAQVSVGININISDQPEWGPVGYDYAEYYYLPDIEAYYYVPRRQFVYLSGNRWVFSASLPSRYAYYDLYSGYKVVLTTPYAYKHFHSHKVKYVKYKNYKNKQGVIKYKHDKGKHEGHYKQKGKSKNNGKGHGKGHH
jgi:hypothetical protein